MNARPETYNPLLSSKDFASFGVGVVAYVRQVTVDGEAGYAIHAADGTPLTIVAHRDDAVEALRRHELHPVSVH
ncbi:MAG: DUF1150 family protein [Rhodospirillaceae bacterium]